MRIDKHTGLPVGVKRINAFEVEYTSVPTGKNGNNFPVDYMITVVQYFNIKTDRPEYQAYVILRYGSDYREPLHKTRHCISENNAIMAAMRWCDK